MGLQPGQKLGSYEIISQAGAGGMGEVFKALDPRLGRTVAIKVLPERTADSADLKERFAREAKAISSLNHPNICVLYDVGHQDGRDFLVMEYLEGQTLAERLLKGALPISDVLKIAVQIADALESAHRQGLVHRDLKPGNVMMTREGAKLLDFGLAKLAVEESENAHLSGLTLTTPLTMSGTLIGTMQYMSPEQLEGKEADARSDIFAFGALLYEMAAGKRPFDGASQASLIASILKENPPGVSRIQPMVPPMLDQAISQCLEKDPDNRWQTAGDLKRALMWVANGGSQTGVPAPVSRRRRTRERVQWGLIAALLLVSTALGGITWQQSRVQPPVLRTTILLDKDAAFGNIAGGSVELSPDGTKVAYVARDSTGGDTRIWVRPIDTLTAMPLPGTEGAAFPFWSPDSRYLAFFANNKLMKILARGGPTLTLCEAVNGRGGSWNQDEVIIFTPNYEGPLFRVSAAGGQPMALTVLDTASHDYTHRWAHFLPNGRDYLFYARTQGDSGGERDAICVASLDKPGFTRLFLSRSNPAYSNGQLLFVREGVLMAQPFDIGGLQVTGDAFPIAEQVTYIRGWSRGVFSCSNSGLLAYRQGMVTSGSQLKIVDLEGRELQAVGDVVMQSSFSVSHDQTRVAVTMLDQSSANNDIWIRDLQRGIRNRLTFDPEFDLTPVWSPDDSLIAFASRRAGNPGLFVKPASGAEEEKNIWPIKDTIFVSDWSQDGRHIICVVNTPRGQDIWAVPTTPGEEPFSFMQTQFGEWDPRLSPDGRWMAFSSDESGQEEVYVAPFPGPGGKWQVSVREGDRPGWSRDGRKIYYLDNEDRLNVASVDGTGSAMRIGKVEPLFPVNGSRPGPIFRLMADDGRLLVNQNLSEGDDSTIVLVQNWSREIHR